MSTNRHVPFPRWRLHRERVNLCHHESLHSLGPETCDPHSPLPDLRVGDLGAARTRQRTQHTLRTDCEEAETTATMYVWVRLKSRLYALMRYSKVDTFQSIVYI